MNTTDFTATIFVDKSLATAFNAIKNFPGWWSEDIEGATEKVGDEFIYQFKDVHYCKLRLVELLDDKRLVWLVLDNYFKFAKDQSEWIGTKLVFDITTKGDQTVVKFTHEGLMPQHECYEICNRAWTNYITNSLRSLIMTGKGQPNVKEDDSFNEHLAQRWKLEQALL